MDSCQSEPLLVEGLHYAELEDVMTLPFPLSVREQFEEMQRNNPNTSRDSSDSESDESPRRKGRKSRRAGHSGSYRASPADRGDVRSSDQKESGSPPRTRKRDAIKNKFASLPHRRGQKAESVYAQIFKEGKDK